MSQDLDAFIRERRAELVEFFITRRGLEPAHAASVVREALLRAQIKRDDFPTGQSLFSWCVRAGDAVLRTGEVSVMPQLTQLYRHHRDALGLRAEGLDDRELAERLRVAVDEVPGLLAEARAAAEFLGDQC